MSTGSYIGIAAGAISLLGYIPYALRIVRGGMKPERASSLIWMLSNILIFMSYYELGARDTVWVPLAYVIGSATVAALSFRYGSEGWGALEKFALVVAFISAIRWIFFDKALFTLLANLAIGVVAYFNQIKSLVKRPEYEKYQFAAWCVFFVGAALNLFAVSHWTVEIAAMPVVVFVVNAAFFVLVSWNALRDRKSPEDDIRVQ